MSGYHPHSQFHLALPTKEQQMAIGKPTVPANAQVHSGSKVRTTTTIYNEAAELKPPQPKPVYISTCHIRSINQRLDRHRDDLNEIFEGTSKSSKTTHDLQNTKISLKRAEELCATRCMNATIRISKLEHLVEALAAQVEELTLFNNKPKCVDCLNPFSQIKKSHKKCPDCFLSRKVKLCKNCSKPFTPKHHSFKYCPCCSRK